MVDYPHGSIGHRSTTLASSVWGASLSGCVAPKILANVNKRAWILLVCVWLVSDNVGLATMAFFCVNFRGMYFTVGWWFAIALPPCAAVLASGI